MPSEMRNVIAVDGPTASGKGTLARRLAEAFDFAYLDTGGLYRATALGLLRQRLTDPDSGQAVEAARNIHPDDLDDPALRDEQTGNMASKVAAMQPVRDALFTFQRQFAANPPGKAKGAVLDGRDIGTIICPDAAVKLFITAAQQVRAERRYRELLGKGQAVTLDQILGDLQARDARDSGRSNAPLACADDAVLLDTSYMDIETAFSAARKACIARWTGEQAG